jgi:hypothetical protein
MMIKYNSLINLLVCRKKKVFIFCISSKSEQTKYQKMPLHSLHLHDNFSSNNIIFRLKILHHYLCVFYYVEIVHAYIIHYTLENINKR